MTSRLLFCLILGIDAFILFTQSSQLSISSDEAKLLYGEFSLLQFLLQTSLNIFTQNDFALRFVMILLHIMSAILFYNISKRYLFTQRNRLWLLLMFLLLPGVVSSAIVVNSAGLLIFGLLFYIYLSDKFSPRYLNSLLLLYALVGGEFVYLFLGLAISYLTQKRKREFFYMMFLYFLSSGLYGFDVVGPPSGHFLDAIGVYSAIFTPIVFIYIFYALYRRYLANRVDTIWYISTTALLFSLALSFRQSVQIENFAPYLILALPLAAQTFIASYRVRLREFRTGYRVAFIVSFAFLLLNTLAVFFNKELYLVTDEPKKHFVYEMHVAKELADSLKSQHIYCVKTEQKMQLRLKFYQIEFCEENILQEIPIDEKKASNVTISYKNRVLYKANVTKVNIN